MSANIRQWSFAVVLVLAFSPRVIGGQIQETLFRKELLTAVPGDVR